MITRKKYNPSKPFTIDYRANGGLTPALSSQLKTIQLLTFALFLEVYLISNKYYTLRSMLSTTYNYSISYDIYGFLYNYYNIYFKSKFGRIGILSMYAVFESPLRIDCTRDLQPSLN